ncbi:glycoside hydrolase family 88 protein [Saccharibacillus sp. CPCC 101409]|uniref:glycoside hydrolase family 88 protein n=1 Tax=Saccharibacillus sp. CPCC 101409 TaxID=3058041 RepID=UPI002673912E|nr:glycoside hydrolase family 88 protein [Saccharibacillus sp. CPCC 101409]MDO3413253.1 glycoside hydrolase family 88 protein [Saccharibacillus sp. CPCC 101409]
MLDRLNDDDRLWLDGIWEKIQVKMRVQTERVGSRIPYIPENGRYLEDKAETDIYWWTNGFWPGMLWQMYRATGEERYKLPAEEVERKLDAALEGFEGLHHDVGFMWMHSAVANYRLTGSSRSRTRGLHAANLLAGRYNPRGRFIRAWNDDCTGWIIIDCLMNLPLLYWAGRETRDPRFADIAVDHADAALKHLLRPDGSSVHIAILDPHTGDLLETPGGQGFEAGSSWSRGQAWALYGMALSHVHTGEDRYLQASKRTAHYFLANIAASGFVPPIDFRAPAEPSGIDTTAGVCAACGLLELAELVGGHERELYLRGALNILRAIERDYCDWNPERDSIVSHGTGSYHGRNGDYEVPIIYGDYFLIEAVLKLKGQALRIW